MKAMLAEDTAEVASSSLVLRDLADKPAVIERLKLYREKVEALVTLGLKYDPCTREDVIEHAF